MLLEKLTNIYLDNHFPRAVLLDRTNFMNDLDSNLNIEFEDSLNTFINLILNNTNYNLNKMSLNNHPDLFILQVEDKKSITIEQGHLMQEFASKTPSLADKKVILIKDIDKLNLACANSLLKIIEEPNVNLYIISYTRYPLRLIPTILSRLVKFKIDLRETKCFVPQNENKDLLLLSKELLEILNTDLLQVGYILDLVMKWLNTYEDNLLYLLYKASAELAFQGCRSDKLWEFQDQLVFLTKNIQHGHNLNLALQLQTIFIGLTNGRRKYF